MRCTYKPDCEGAHYARGYCRSHYNWLWSKGALKALKPIGLSTEERFWRFVNKTGSCWLWTGATTKSGYGAFTESTTYKSHRAHRYSYALVNGAIPDEMTLDHLCRVKTCVNPDHLEPVTVAENLQRGARDRGRSTHCRKGHPYTPERPTPRGQPFCATCRSSWSRTAYLKRKARQAESS